ncbi:MAG: TolC family protein [Flavisolibacter sp.]|jgi:outer membrane protein TolC|nr:TolC family protein [Flavisolibacter sp.]
MNIKFCGIFLKAKLFVALLLFALSSLQAQKTKPATPVVRDTSLSAVEAKLVELALKGPAVQEAIHRNKINEYQVKAAKMNWVNMLTISTNYNDQSFVNNSNANIVYPKYFFGFTVPLGTLLSKTQVRAAEEQVKISVNSEEQLRRNIKAEVVGKYKQYRAIGQIIVIQRELMDDVQAALITSEENFRKGTITVEAYNSAQRSKNEEASRLINLQLEQDLIKLDIERMIGTSLESVIK